MNKPSLFLCNLLFALSVVLIQPQQVTAITYKYRGNLFEVIEDGAPEGTYTNSMGVSGRFTIATPFTSSLTMHRINDLIMDYSFFDGRNTLSLNSGGTSFHDFWVSSGPDGEILQWSIVVGTWTSTQNSDGSAGIETLGSIRTQNDIDGLAVNKGIVDSGEIFEVWWHYDDKGEFHTGIRGNDTALVSENKGAWVVVPEPSFFILFGTGILIVVFNRSLRRRLFIKLFPLISW